MAGAAPVSDSCRRLPPLLLLLLLLPAGRAAAVVTADTRCIRLLNSTNENGHRRSNVLVNDTCGCDRLSLFVMLNSSGMPIDCGQNGSWHDAKQTAPVSDGVAVFRTVVAGCFEARCTCANGSHCRKYWHFDGLDYYDYNLEISAVQLAGRPPRLDVHLKPDKNATQFYFPRLEVRLYRCPEERDKACGHHRVAGPLVADAAPDVRVELNGSREPLTPGRYRLEVLPSDSWVCQGSNNGCKRIVLPVRLSDTPIDAGAVLPAAGDDRMKALYAVVGVTLAVIAAGLVFVWRECTAVRPGQRAPFSAKTAAPSGAQVLLVHLWAGQRLAQLKSDLRDAGLQVSDFQERKLASLLRAVPVADVLTSERLRHAKIVFLCSERALQLEQGPATALGGGGAENGTSTTGGGFSASSRLVGHEATFSAVLHCVRNSALAQDYRRVFVVLPEGGGGGDEASPAALVPGCRFRWPADGPELIRQLGLSPTETDCDHRVV
ncbi:hypothetical protein FJT64_017771 [Amphibalanus amphitrite]|uniref:SEFIR domain-containing protein n=1 Tax=Amphibalanus amphitrite TaxID=1232801 RepID=A0A6A4X5R9_AMPAM|nr:hypothetical protein FJT64_017771 [Amphibalanus amphitrite]